MSERLALVRLGTHGLPIGSPTSSSYRIYAYERPRYKWTALRIFPKSEREAHGMAETYYNEHGERVHVVVLDRDGFVTLSLPARFGVLAGEKNPRARNTRRPTFAQARDAAFVALEHDGWTIKRGLKVPKAEKTIDGNRVILYFRPQAVWMEVKGLAPARSLHTDIRDIDPRKWVMTLAEEAQGSIDLEASFRNPKGGKKRANPPDKRYYPYTDKLDPQYVRSVRGFMADDLDIVRRYAKARADYHGKTQMIGKSIFGPDMWFTDDSGKPLGQARYVESVHPSKGNPSEYPTFPPDAIYLAFLDDGRGSIRRVTQPEAVKIAAVPAGSMAQHKGKPVRAMLALPSIYKGVWRSSGGYAVPLWDWVAGLNTCKKVKAWIERAGEEERHRAEKSRAWHAFQELGALMCGPIVNAKGRR